MSKVKIIFQKYTPTRRGGFVPSGLWLFNEFGFGGRSELERQIEIERGYQNRENKNIFSRKRKKTCSLKIYFYNSFIFANETTLFTRPKCLHNLEYGQRMRWKLVITYFLSQCRSKECRFLMVQSPVRQFPGRSRNHKMLLKTDTRV